MTASHLSLMPGSTAPASQPDGAASQGSTQLHLPAGAHIHLHLGAVPAPAVQPGAGYRISAVPLVLAGLALLGGGYLAGSHGPTARTGDDGSGALASASPLPPAPDLPAAPGELPPALRAQLARPPVVTPPPGASAAPGTAGAPARNPFGLSN